MEYCPHSDICAFYASVSPSLVRRVTYAAGYAYCRGNHTEMCAIYSLLETGSAVAPDLMPNGTFGDYAERKEIGRTHRFLVIEDSPVFAALASTTIASHFRGAEIVHRDSFDAAVRELGEAAYSAIICGFGLDGDRTAHDIRRLTDVPMIVLTGRMGHIEAPRDSHVVAKGAGPEALASALEACLG